MQDLANLAKFTFFTQLNIRIKNIQSVSCSRMLKVYNFISLTCFQGLEYPHEARNFANKPIFRRRPNLGRGRLKKYSNIAESEIGWKKFSQGDYGRVKRNEEEPFVRNKKV